jgi:hypothetical protein
LRGLPVRADRRPAFPRADRRPAFPRAGGRTASDPSSGWLMTIAISTLIPGRLLPELLHRSAWNSAN